MKIAVIVVIAAALALSTALTLIRAIGTVRRNSAELKEKKSVLANGTAATATVRSIEQTNATLGEQPIVIMDLTVAAEEGEFRATVQTAIPIVHIPRFQEGKRIDVKYVKEGNELKVEVVGAYLPGSLRSE